MKTDIEIAQEAEMLHIREVAQRYGITEEELELYGKYKAKLTDELWEQVMANFWLVPLGRSPKKEESTWNAKSIFEEVRKCSLPTISQTKNLTKRWAVTGSTMWKRFCPKSPIR